MSKRGDIVPSTGSFFSGSFGTMNLSHNVNIVNNEMAIVVSLVEDHERIQMLENQVSALQDKMTELVEHINKMNKVLQEIYFAPGAPGSLIAQDHFEELATTL